MLTQFNHPKTKELSQDFLDHLWEFQDVINYVYKNFLCKPYAKEYTKLCSKAYKIGHGHHTIYRPNHGLAHTLRCAHAIPEVATQFSRSAKGKHRYLFTQEDIKRMQVAMLFFVVGRQNEMGFFSSPELYYKFRRASSQAFQDYAEQHLMWLYKSKEEIKRYADIIFDYHNLAKSDPAAMIMKQAHCLDLLRCMKEEEFALKCRADLVDNFTHFAESREAKADALAFANRKVDEMIHDSAKRIVATGNRISHGIHKDKGHFSQFERCSKDTEYCLRALHYAKGDKEPSQEEVKRRRRYSI